MLKSKYMALVGCLLLLTTCQSLASPPEPKSTFLPPTATVAIQNHWKSNLARWLQIAYTEDEHVASFAAISANKIDHPSLYATYSVVGIYHVLNQPIRSSDEIQKWIASLQTENGAYADPDALPKYAALLETNWAVATLGYLDLSAPQAGKTISFLRSLQTHDGFFLPDQDIGGDPQSQKIVASFWAIDTLMRLKVDLAKQDFLVSTKRALLDYLNSDIKENAEPNISLSANSLIALHTLAMLDSDAIDSETRTILQQQAENFSLSANPAVLAMAINLFETVKILGLSISDSKIANLRGRVETQLYPSILQASNAGRPVEPMQTYLTLKVGDLLRVKYVDSSDLFAHCEPYRVAGGWNTFFIPRGDPAATAEALFIAKEIELEKYNPDKVANFLEQSIAPSIAAKHLRNLRFALQGLGFLKRLPNSTTLQEIQSTVAAAILQSPKKQSAGLLFEYALLVYERGWKWPSELDTLAVQTLQETARNKTRIDTLHNMLILELVSKTEVIPKKQLAQEIAQLWVERSGFKAMASATETDILSTFLAVQALGMIGTLKPEDKATIEIFLDTCKQEYGYSFSCPNSSAKNQETASPTIAATFYALKLRQMIK